MPLEIGKGLYEFARGRARTDVMLVPRAQVADEPREEAFGRPHGLERELRESVPEAAGRAPELALEERAEIDMREDELDALDFPVEARARACEEACAAPRLVGDEREEPREEEKGGEDEEEVRHGG